MHRVVAITGASAGIGRATALRLARDGASIAICARRGDRLRVVADEIVKAGGTVLSVVADVTRETDMQTFVDQTLDKWGQLDVMMCNAGYGLYGTIDTVPGDRMREVMDVNYMGTYFAACGAAGLPSPVARASHHHFLHRRKTRHPVHGSVFGNEVRAGRTGRMPAR